MHLMLTHKSRCWCFFLCPLSLCLRFISKANTAGSILHHTQPDPVDNDMTLVCSIYHPWRTHSIPAIQRIALSNITMLHSQWLIVVVKKERNSSQYVASFLSTWKGTLSPLQSCHLCKYTSSSPVFSPLVSYIRGFQIDSLSPRLSLLSFSPWI